MAPTLEEIIANASQSLSPVPSPTVSRAGSRDSTPSLSLSESRIFGHSSSPAANGSSEELLNVDRGLGSTNPRKRPAEDMTQYAQEVSRKIKLKPSSQEALEKFSKCSQAEQLINLAGMLFKVNDGQEALHPPEAPYTMPRRLESCIDKGSLSVLLSPSIASYLKDIPMDSLISVLEEDPKSGFTEALKVDHSKYSVILTRVQKQLTNRRYAIKKTIEDSLGTETVKDGVTSFPGRLNIADLCDKLVAIGMHRSSSVKVDVPLCGRIAYLRQVLVDNPKSPKYWEKVDASLEEARKTYQGLVDADTRMSKMFGIVLDYDLKSYGAVDLNNLTTRSSKSRNVTAAPAHDSDQD